MSVQKKGHPFLGGFSGVFFGFFLSVTLLTAGVVPLESILLPLLPFGPAEQPWHSSQYPSLPPVYVQNASLEIAWSRVVFDGTVTALGLFVTTRVVDSWRWG